MRCRSQWIALGIAAMLLAGLLAPIPARAQPAQTPDAVEPEPPSDRWQRAAEIATKAVDVLVFRPVGLAGLVAGGSLFVPVAVITSPGGRGALEEAAELFVFIPYRFVFERRLGEF